MSVDLLYAMLDCALGISPVTSFSGVRLHADSALVHVQGESFVLSNFDDMAIHGARSLWHVTWPIRKRHGGGVVRAHYTHTLYAPARSCSAPYLS